jgi:thioredoxin-related protein
MRVPIKAAKKTGDQHTIIAVMLLFFAVITFNNRLAADKKEPIYDPALDVKTAVKGSLATAQKESKHILLMFGGNWCPWCHKLHHLLKSDNAIEKFLNENYILVMVDVGEKTTKPLNRDLVNLYRVKGFGYPSLAVLEEKGGLICSQSTGVLEKGKAHDPDRVLSFLKAQAPDK